MLQLQVFQCNHQNLWHMEGDIFMVLDHGEIKLGDVLECLFEIMKNHCKLQRPLLQNEDFDMFHKSSTSKKEKSLLFSFFIYNREELIYLTIV